MKITYIFVVLALVLPLVGRIVLPALSILWQIIGDFVIFAWFKAWLAVEQIGKRKADKAYTKLRQRVEMPRKYAA